MSSDSKHALTRSDTTDLAAVNAEFDELVCTMQTPAALTAVDALFVASAEELSGSSIIGNAHHDGGTDTRGA